MFMKTHEPEPDQKAKFVFGPEMGPLEAPAKVKVDGPFYKDASEKIPDLDSPEVDKPTSLLDVDRRDFLKLFSSSALVASAAACVRRPEEKIIPYIDQPIDSVVGRPTYYATTCGECPSACGLVVKTKSGRPIKVEGQSEHPISNGATCSVAQASLQGLYHPERRKVPRYKVNGKVYDGKWDEIISVLGSQVGGAKKIGIITGGSTGNRRPFFVEFLKHFGSSEDDLYTYEANSLFSAISKAHEIAFGERDLPRADLRKAELIVGIGTDFLEVGVSPVYYNKSFASFHSFQGQAKGKFIQFEASMSQTGAKSDERYAIGLGSEFGVALALLNEVLSHPNSKGSASEREEVKKFLAANQSSLEAAKQELAQAGVNMAAVAQELIERSSVILVGGSANFDQNATLLQLSAIMLNTLVEAYGTTLMFDKGWMPSPVRAGDLNRFLESQTSYDVLFIVDVNPVFALSPQFGLAEKIRTAKSVVSLQPMPCEVEELADFILNGHHPLESWGDEQPVAGFWSLRQPVVRSLTDSRQAEDLLLWIAAAAGKPISFKSYRDYLLSRWKAVHEAAGMPVKFDVFYKAVLRMGFVGKTLERKVRSLALGDVKAVGQVLTPSAQGGLLLAAPLDYRLREGKGADKPLLQEIGNSMTTVTWDSCLEINPNTAARLGLKFGDLVTVESQVGNLEVAVFPLPGVHPQAVFINRGNGHVGDQSLVSKGIGVNPLPLFPKVVDSLSGEAVTSGLSVTLKATGKRHRLAAMQKHNDIANRKDIVKKISVAKAAAKVRVTQNLDDVPDLYPKLPQGDYRWGMSVDLGACTGCSACMAACSVENNIPQVGRDEIIKGREMHWIRLDRYFAGNPDNPEVSFQPVMCQQCNHAPCEAVCPVYATTHDPEGYNAQTYNRCVGTRYCANACPYKVRRFNWWTHRWNEISTDPKHRNPRALNPDVTVRTRGIMEKCTFCVQRISVMKHAVKKRGSALQDGEIKTACQQVCPADAIVFGDLLDSKSRVYQLRKDFRSFLMLNGDHEHQHYGIKTLPNVNYLAEVTLKESVIHQDKHHGEAEAGTEKHG